MTIIALLCISLLSYISGYAQQWSKTDAIKPSGLGTQEYPYEITRAGNLVWLSVNVNAEGAKGKYYIQTEDIDLSGKEWMPIGNNNAKGFFGNYDGQGHEISGMRVDWGDYALAMQGASATSAANKNGSGNICYGLFGWFGGELRNLVIDGAELYRDGASTRGNSNIDLRVGILAGGVGPSDVAANATDVVIENVIVRRSSITDTPTNKMKCSAYFIGGLIGDLHGAGYESTAVPNKEITISEIICNADINLPNTDLSPSRELSNKGVQYNVGGLVGRARSVKTTHLPQNAVYTGTINAPYALVGPIFGVARYNSAPVNTYNGLYYAYAGDFNDKAKGTSTTDANFPTAYYLDYKIYDYSGSETPPTCTNIDDSNLNANNLGTRTLAKQPDYFGKDDKNKESGDKPFSSTWIPSKSEMAMFQGVNRGKYLASLDALKTLVEINFNEEGKTYPMEYNEANGYWQLQKSAKRNLFVEIHHTAWDTYQARTIDAEGNDVVGDYRYSWSILNSYWASTAIGTYSTPEVKYTNMLAEGHSLYVTVCDETGEAVLDGTSKVTGMYYDDFVASLERTLLPTGAQFCAKLTFGDGLTVPFDESGWTADWCITRSGTDYTDIVPYCTWHIDESKEFQDGQYILILDHVIAQRNIKVNLIDSEGNTRTAELTGSNGIPTTEYRNLHTYKNAPNTFYTRWGYKGQGVGSLLPNEYDTLIYTYDVHGENTPPVDGANPPLLSGQTMKADFDTLRVNTIYFADKYYTFKVSDPYGGEYQYTENNAPRLLKVSKAEEMRLDVVDHKIIPVYTIGDFKVVTENLEEAELTYAWTIVYRKDGEVVKTLTSTAPYLDDFELYDVDITLVATDKFGETATATYSHLLDQQLALNIATQTTAAGYQFTADLGLRNGLPTPPIDGTYQWYGVSGSITGNISDYTPLPGEIMPTLSVSDSGAYQTYCVVFTTDEGEQYISYGYVRDIIYVYNRDMTALHNAGTSIAEGGKYKDIYDTYPDGDDANDGSHPSCAVKTMVRAYELLDGSKQADVNTIVVMGYLNDNDYLIMPSNLPTGKYNKMATITGTDHRYLDSEGTLGLYGADVDYSSDYGGGRRGLSAPTIFRDITLSGKSNINKKDYELFLYCNLNDLTVDEGVKIEDYAETSANSNGLGDYSMPAITIVGGYHEYDNASLPYPSTNAMPGTTTITVRSGCFARIIASARNNGAGANGKSQNIFGHPDEPHRVVVNLDMVHHSLELNEYYPTATQQYKYDIGLLVGGQTDGSVFVDAMLEMHAGSVGRFIAGNISYGRKVGDGYPPDSFFGSTVLNIYGGSIGELFGGTLGRVAHTHASYTTEKCYAFFYGRSIINLYGGNITDNIYGAGAGGVMGIGDNDETGFHTMDINIPYYTGTVSEGVTRSHEIRYGDYFAAKGKMPKMTLSDGITIDLEHSYSEVNIYGGAVHGNVYGGGYGYSKQVKLEHALSQAGNVYGTPKVSICGGIVKGNVYGGGEGTDAYYNDPSIANNDEERAKFKSLANVYLPVTDGVAGTTTVHITGGVVEGKVFGGGQGMASLADMAQVYGHTSVTLDGGEVNGHIYGGCDYASIYGDTHVKVLSGTVGDCIFGGSRGDDTDGAESDTRIVGDTHVEIHGGDWAPTPYVNKKNRTGGYRSFNIYGGGDHKCAIEGDTHIEMTRSLMAHKESFIPRAENPNSYEQDNYSDFQGPYMDLTYRRFSVYGGGLGVKTQCLNTHVHINISTDMVAPHGNTLADFLDHQSLFDIAGGGYSGDVGHWNDDYTAYIGGDCNVLIEGYTYARKVIGGGFYGSCNNTRTTVRSGSLRQIYGGSLLGYVHQRAYMTIGNRMEDSSAAEAKALNDNLYVTENLYGGNDVRGIIGTSLVSGNNTDDAVWTADAETAGKGIEVNIYGGTFMGDIYGAGNGHYRGYYVPGWARYEDGPERMYRRVRGWDGSENGGKVYNSRPMVGRVNMDIRGNSDDDYVHLAGNLFGGGRECTIGKWGITDIGTGTATEGLRELIDGGRLHINIGGYTHIDGIMYMGVEGALCARQSTIPAGLDIYGATFDGTTTNDLNRLGNTAYYSWYYNTANRRYEPGFPAAGTAEGNFGMDGSQLFRRYISNIEMKADVELTFYRDIVDPATGGRKHWVPAEEAFQLYDAEGIVMKSFFLGGKCGSMTSKNVKHYDDPSAVGGDDFGAIYRVSMPAGVTIKDMLVMGAENAIIRFYPYTDNLHGYDDTAGPLHEYVGGIGPRDNVAGSTVSKLTAMCTFDPQLTADTGSGESELDRLYGGIIYGGCYNSGTVSGDVVLNVASNMLGWRVDQAIADSKNKDINDLSLQDWFGERSSLKHYIGRVYGGGYGRESLIDGDTYVNLLLDFKGMNVFGGGMKGDVSGASHITYAGSESGSYIFGSIYGGGLQGSMGKGNAEDGIYLKPATNVVLYSGNVDKVYGGSCLGELYGSVRMTLSDKITNDFSHLDYERYVEFTNSVPDWSGSRLIAGNVFGGNDIAGTIHYTSPAGLTEADQGYYTVSIDVNEEPNAEKKTTVGTSNGYNGFPHIGNLYGGSNGNYGEHNTSIYTAGEIALANGQIDQDGHMIIETVLLSGKDATGNTVGEAYAVPNVDRTWLNITGGSIINAYGGGNEATIIDHTRITVDYPEEALDARAGFDHRNDLQRVWQTSHITNMEQIQEVLNQGTDGAGRNGYIFNHHIHRLFGGNNNADMDIQPDWYLVRGHVCNVYSGGNFGKMTYFDAEHARGLSLTINSRPFHAVSVFGGGRVGNIAPAVPTTYTTGGTAITLPEDFYGATLEIKDGVIDHVYGGNDVSGNVDYGTHVIINGAISGDVYSAGNGNYKYKYESDNTSTKIEERYDNAYGGRYFVLPQLAAYAGEVSALQKIQAINSYRPNVDRTKLSIEGKDDKIAYVHGSVYCGGNSSTLNATVNNGLLSDIKMEIGDNVVLNNVFLGSNGQDLVSMTGITERLNEVDLSQPSGHTDGEEAMLYPTLLDEYMRAVEVCGVPDEFTLCDGATNAYIGNFYVGGNRGSMMTDQTISIEFPADLVIFGKIVGGSNNANVTYKDVTHIGGLNKRLAEGLTHKVYLKVRSRFEPWALDYPEDGNYTKIRRVLDQTEVRGQKSFSRYRCNVYGGCFTSGRTVGGIHIDLYSDMTAMPDGGSELQQAFTDAGLDGMKREMILNGINRSGDEQHRTFALIGGGYGKDTEVYGDIEVSMLPSGEGKHPSATTIFGGSQEGTVIGNTTVKVLDGTVLTNLYGASEATPLYGSSQVIIGYPTYYESTADATYSIKRADQLSSAKDHLKNTIGVREGDIISTKVYDMIEGTAKESNFAKVETAPSDIETALTWDDIESDIETALTWDDIEIHIGDPTSLSDPNATYYGQGNVYGGGYISPGSTVGSLGNNTVCIFPAADTDEANALTERYTYEGYNATKWQGLGGNSTILIWDNHENADLNLALSEPGSDDATLKDHITIGTGRYVEARLDVGDDVINKFSREVDATTGETRYVQQSSRRLQSGEKVYNLEADGGIYGDGRMVNVEGLRTCDIAYYGYAGSTPQYPKLLNTLQRIDVLSVTDCCMRLHGARDIVTNGNTNPAIYSITRVGELQMYSSIHNYREDLDAGTRDDSELHAIQHLTPRSRNYIGLGSNTRYIGAMQSNVAFSDRYHYPSGKYTPQDGDNENETLQKEYDDEGPTYQEFKALRIHKYYQADENGNYKTDAVGNYVKSDDFLEAFYQRNMGTSANMIGLNNGDRLHVLGLDESNDEEYYGPALGVFEVKLLTLTLDEGGGYIYALNHHEQPEGSNHLHFLEVPGNFVFPGAYYSSDEPDKVNYVFDDCTPMEIGFEGYANPNEDAPSHFWYVNGTKFYFNLTLSAYTSSDRRNFTLDKENGKVYLSLVEPGADIEVEYINWEKSDNRDSDVQNYYRNSDASKGKDYNLYLSVGDKAEKAHDLTTNTEDEFVMQVSRSDYESGDTYTAPADNRVDYSASGTSLSNDYKNHSADDKNTAMLGITLWDNEDNASRDYFEEHLKEPEKVIIAVKATNKSGVTSHYYVTLTIHYMLSPIVTGNIVIENGALPGEYVYANSYDVDIDKDENIIIDSYDWYYVPKGIDNYLDNDGHLYATAIDEAIEQGDILPVDAEAYFTATDKTQLHIPAYRYRNGWGLLYRVKAGDMKSYVTTATDAEALRVYPDKPYKRMIEVHNYHKMKPQISADRSIEDLHLTEGCWVYIEDQTDMDYFYTWLREHQSASGATTETGDELEPQYGRGITIYLMDDVEIPQGISTDLRFDGIWHGNGHTVDMGAHSNFLTNTGGTAKVYNTGFIGGKTAKVMGDGFAGTIENTYLRHSDGTGDAWLDAITGQVTEATSQILYGRMAFDLNGFYLQRRAKDFDANAADEKVVHAMYADGEYRYARSSEDGLEHSALRKYSSTDLTKDDTPNYRSQINRIRLDMDRADYGSITGFDATQHNDLDPIDETRYVEADDRYEPIYRIDQQGSSVVKPDYLFFGQVLGTDAYPTVLTKDNYETNRVYRVSGFHRSKDDQGYYFNRAARVLDPTLTAIDFQGYPNHSETAVYYAPMTDMTEDGKLASLDIADDITHNLLIYDTTQGIDQFTPYVYSTTTDESDIRTHIIYSRASQSAGEVTYAPSAPLLHVVDKHDFNAPIEFAVTERAWYERQPENYDNGDGDAWDGIVLPFTVDKVLAQASEPSAEGDHGWLTHFYGRYNSDEEADSHEYWLRKLSGVSDGKAYFTRPASEYDVLQPQGNDVQEHVSASYHYVNTYFPDTYGITYEHTDEAYLPAGVDYRDYPHITAGMPYLIAYPGERFREFDLSGEYYCYKKGLANSEAVPQTIVYENATGVTVPVTDLTMVEYVDGDYHFRGTMLHVDASDVLVSTGDKFESSADEILPFRTYMLSDDAEIQIKSRGDGSDEEKPEDINPAASDITVTVEDDVLVVTSSVETTLDLYNVLGQKVRTLHVKSGRNTYRGLAGGVYICHGTKVMIGQRS